MIDTAPIRRSGWHILNAIYIVIMMLAFRQHRANQAHNPAEATARAPREWPLKLQPNLDLLPATVSS